MVPSSSKGILKRKLEEAAFKKQMEKVDITRDFAGMSVSPSPKCQRVLAPIKSPGGPSSSGVVLVPNTPSPPPVPPALQPDIIVDSANKYQHHQLFLYLCLKEHCYLPPDQMEKEKRWLSRIHLNRAIPCMFTRTWSTF